MTVAGSASKSVHFLPKFETLVFAKNETEKFVTIDLLTEKRSEWRNDDSFFVKLELDPSQMAEDSKVRLGKCFKASVFFKMDTVQSTDSVVAFKKSNFFVKESSGSIRIRVGRSGNLKDKFLVHWSCEDITARNGVDYRAPRDGTVSFNENEIAKYFDIEIIDDTEVEKDETFLVRLSTPSPNARLGDISKAVVTIVNDDRTSALMTKIDRLIPNLLDSLKPGGQSWKAQFVRFLNVNGGEVQEAEMGDYVCHLLAFPWKAVAAFVPPPSFLGGWLTFFCALILIGLLTALVGDAASTFGCLVNLDNTITAITLIAIGTSLPDTFASKVAALQDKDADNAVGNVTGSNSVNVFLGLGLPWFIASIYWWHQGKDFAVPSQGLNFSVVLYTIFSLLTVGLMLARRHFGLFGKAELGGPTLTKYASACYLLFLWALYVLLSILDVYKYI